MCTLLIIGCDSTKATKLEPTIIIERDCSWEAVATAWTDSNLNGLWDENEPPLEGVAFFVDDIKNGFQDVASESVSASNGKSILIVWLPGCPQKNFEVYAQAPDNFRLTTPERILVGDGGNGETFLFGYVKTE